MMDLERAFTYIWKDPQWLNKLVIGGLLTLTGIGSIAVLGYLTEMSRQVAAQEEELLPKWDQIGDHFINGLKILGVTLIWCLPVIILTIVISILPAGLLLIMPEDAEGPAIALISVFSACFWVIFMVYILAVNLLTPTLWVPIAEGAQFKELLNPKMAWDIFRSNAGGFIVAMLIGYLAGSVLSIAGVILCVIGTFLTATAAQLIIAHLVGQATLQAREATSLKAE